MCFSALATIRRRGVIGAKRNHLCRVGHGQDEHSDTSLADAKEQVGLARSRLLSRRLMEGEQVLLTHPGEVPRFLEVRVKCAGERKNVLLSSSRRLQACDGLLVVELVVACLSFRFLSGCLGHGEGRQHPLHPYLAFVDTQRIDAPVSVTTNSRLYPQLL